MCTPPARSNGIYLHLAFTQYCHYQYCMLTGKTGGHGGNHIHILRNIDCKIQRLGGAIKEVVNAENSID